MGAYGIVVIFLRLFLNVSMSCFACFLNVLLFFQFPLVEGVDCYVTKSQRLALPKVVPRGVEDKGKKWPDDERSIVPRGKVNKLLDILVPENELKVKT